MRSQPEFNFGDGTCVDDLCGRDKVFDGATQRCIPWAPAPEFPEPITWQTSTDMWVPPASALSGTTFVFDLEFVKKYVGGNGAVFHDGPAVRNSFTVGLGRGYANIWLQNGLDDSDFSSNYGDKINYSAGLADKRGMFAYDIGAIYIDAVGLGKMPNGDVYGPFIKLTHAGKIGPLGRLESVKIESYIPGGDIVEGGWLIHIREKVDWSGSNGWGLNLSLGPTFDDGAFGFEPGIIGVIELGVSVPFGGLTLNPGYRVSTPIEGAHDRETVRGWSVSTSFNF